MLVKVLKGVLLAGSFAFGSEFWMWYFLLAGRFIPEHFVFGSSFLNVVLIAYRAFYS